MLVETSNVYITDKSGKKFFNTLCSKLYADSEIRNLHRKLIEAEKYPSAYSFLDIATAEIKVEDYKKV